jgi:hypothetical protein
MDKDERLQKILGQLRGGRLEEVADKLLALFRQPEWWEEEFDKQCAHSIALRGGGCHYASQASRGKDLQVEHPVWCGDASAFHFHATLAGMLRPTLIRDQVIQMGQPCQKRLLAPFGMMEALHGEQFPLNGVMGRVPPACG